jgi:hypothetical protein
MTRPTVGIVAVCYSYDEYILGWAESIKNLTTAPDKIVLVCATAPSELPIDVDVRVSDEPFTFGGWLNLAVDACDTDWIVWVCVDDLYRPNALDGIAERTEDVIAFGMESSLGVWLPVVSPESILEMNANLIPCGSPFRRSLWERLPFQPQHGPYEDWALWVGFAAIGATFGTSGRIDFDYRWHDDTPTALEPLRTQISNWIRSLV